MVEFDDREATMKGRKVQIPRDLHQELLMAAQIVETKRLDLDNAKLRQELVVLRALEFLGLRHERCEIDLDAGIVYMTADSQPSVDGR